MLEPFTVDFHTLLSEIKNPPLATEPLHRRPKYGKTMESEHGD